MQVCVHRIGFWTIIMDIILFRLFARRYLLDYLRDYDDYTIEVTVDNIFKIIKAAVDVILFKTCFLCANDFLVDMYRSSLGVPKVRSWFSGSSAVVT